MTTLKMLPALWFQGTDVVASLAKTNFLIMIFIGLIAVSAVAQGIFVIIFLGKAAKIAKDAHTTAEELKAKLLPLLHTTTETVASAQAILRDATPKIRVVTDNLVETSHMVRSTSTHVNSTLLDVNSRTQKQVARVDGMVTAALETTTEIVENINKGIRVPAAKIAAAAEQAKDLFEGFLAKAKGFAPKPKTPPASVRPIDSALWPPR